MDTALRDPESRRSLCGEDSTVLPGAEKKAQSVLDSAEEALRTARERGAIRHGRRTPRCLRSSIACSKRPRRTSTGANMCRPPSATEVDEEQAGPQGRHEGSQLHRGSCRAAGGRSLEREVDDTVDVLKLAEEALEGI